MDFFGVGLPELIVIGMILLVVFGASRLPKLGENLGRTLGKLKGGIDRDATASGDSPKRSKDGGDDSAQDAEIVD
ncbi:MAG: twin-arginine translocase TatA/TatE family subunit [Chloroflexi bacterium]|nr:twin-arginine translocase TatA/TatE family subunit [Chloroflexota bacterium]